MRTTLSPRRALVQRIAASLWTSVALSCAHAEEAPVAKEALASEPTPPSSVTKDALASERAPAAPVASEAADSEPAPPASVAREALAPEPAPPVQPGPELDSGPTCGGGTGAKPPPFRWPARGAVTSPFGTRRGAPHEGIDISYRSGMAIRAAAAGTVVFSDRKPGYGRVIVLKHAGGYETLYAHNQDNLVMRGSRVEQGQLIADMGSTGESSGPHLHFEVRVGNRPVDPLACLPARTKGR